MSMVIAFILFLLLLGAVAIIAVLTIQLSNRGKEVEASIQAVKQQHDLEIGQIKEASQQAWNSLKAQAEAKLAKAYAELKRVNQLNRALSQYQGIVDTAAKASEILRSAEEQIAIAKANSDIEIASKLEEADRNLNEAREQAAAIKREAAADAAAQRAKTKVAREESSAVLERAAVRSAKVIADAEARAKEIAGNAYQAVQDLELLKRTTIAMRNIINGYGDEYLRPAESLLDDLAEEYSHKEAGRDLETARRHTEAMISAGTASVCDYVEAERRKWAERFVLDAFNGKVDSILSRVKHDNFGVLEQEIRDAFTVVNFQGRSFRNARVTEAYLAARLEELRLGATVQEIRRQDQEEQRQIREQIREEQRAQREHERALRDAEKEEEAIRKAMAKAEAQLADATEQQRAQYEAKLLELQTKLQEAEERGQRAASMASQTKRGHVYIISNVGSFGEDVYKIGLTRRLEPLDRVKELGDASVPFPFDVHAMILCDDAPSVEYQLHKHFLTQQINKVNHRKEFFRANLTQIRSEIESLGLEAKWTMTAEATEYRETLAIEKAIAADPTAREAWINRQLTLDPVSEWDQKDSDDES